MSTLTPSQLKPRSYPWWLPGTWCHPSCRVCPACSTCGSRVPTICAAHRSCFWCCPTALTLLNTGHGALWPLLCPPAPLMQAVV